MAEFLLVPQTHHPRTHAALALTDGIRPYLLLYSWDGKQGAHRYVLSGLHTSFF